MAKTNAKVVHISSAREVPSAHTGFYGAKPFVPEGAHAEALMQAAQATMGQATSWTREDLLHLAPLQHVSTNTRYGKICRIVATWRDQGLVKDISRTEFSLKEHYKNRKKEGRDFREDVAILVHDGYKVGEKFDVMCIVVRWQEDTHITPNLKRTYVRRALDTMLRQGSLLRHGTYEYTRME